MLIVRRSVDSQSTLLLKMQVAGTAEFAVRKGRNKWVEEGKRGATVKLLAVVIVSGMSNIHPF